MNDERAREAQVIRCQMAIEEYFRGQQISVDLKTLYLKLEPYPLLFQFAHMIAFLQMNWKDALRWTMEHRNDIIMHDMVNLNEQVTDAATEADGATNRNDAQPAHKG